MKILKNINPVSAFIAGILLVIFVYHAYTVYQIRAVTVQNRADLNAIIQLINANNPQAQAPSVPVVSQPVSSDEE